MTEDEIPSPTELFPIRSDTTDAASLEDADLVLKERPRGRVLVTFARSWQSLAAIRSLGSRGLSVIAGDEYGVTPGAFSRYSDDSFVYPNPDTDPEGFLQALEKAVEAHRPPEGVPYVLLPVHRETYVVAAHVERLEKLGIRVAVAPSRLIERVRDKGRLVTEARRLGVKVPPTWQPGSAAEARTIAPEVDYPAVVKIRSGAAGVGIEKVESADEMVEAFERLVEAHGLEAPALPIVQRMVEGDDYCVTALLENGTIRAMATYCNVSKVWDNAPGAVRETVHAPGAEREARTLLEGLGWHGIAQVDFVWNGEEGSPAYLIEVNPRLFGGLFQVIASGIDYPWLLYRLALGEDISSDIEEAKLGVRTETPFLGMLALVRHLAESALSMKRLEGAWDEAKERIEGGEHWDGIVAFFRGLGEDGGDHRDEQLAKILEDNKDNLSQLMFGEDPLASLGLLYPVAVFLRHGKVTPELLVGVGRPEEDGEADERGADGPA